MRKATRKLEFFVGAVLGAICGMFVGAVAGVLAEHLFGACRWVVRALLVAGLVGGALLGGFWLRRAGLAAAKWKRPVWLTMGIACALVGTTVDSGKPSSTWRMVAFAVGFGSAGGILGAAIERQLRKDETDRESHLEEEFRDYDKLHPRE